MAEYPLTERQREMIRSIVPGLKDGSIKTTLSVSHTFGSNMTISQAGSVGEFMPSSWKDAKDADFAQFVKCGLFSVAGPSSYHLDEYAIEQAVKNNFQ